MSANASALCATATVNKMDPCPTVTGPVRKVDQSFHKTIQKTVEIGKIPMIKYPTNIELKSIKMISCEEMQLEEPIKSLSSAILRRQKLSRKGKICDLNAT